MGLPTITQRGCLFNVIIMLMYLSHMAKDIKHTDKVWDIIE